MLAITRRRLILVALLMAAGSVAYSQNERYENARSLVARVQNNLRRAEHFTPPNGKEKNVVENNTLSPRDRDVLAEDLRDLRELRRARG